MTKFVTSVELCAFVSAASCDRILGFAVEGALEFVLGRAGDREVPCSVEQAKARVASLRDATARVVESLLAITAGRALRCGDDRALLVSVGGEESEARLTEARAAIETEWLRTFEGALTPVIAWCSANPSELLDAATFERLEAAVARRAATPFLDALCGELPCGPFELRAAPESSASEVAGALGVARIHTPDRTAFALEVEAAPVPGSAASALHCALTLRHDALIVGPLHAVLDHVSTLPRGVAIAIEGVRDECGLAGAFVRLRRNVAKGLSLFGTHVPADRLAAALALGKQLAPLARRDPSALRGLLEVAVALDEGLDRAPLMLLSRWRARAHAIAATLGVNERAVRKAPVGSRAEAAEAALDSESPERGALKALIGEFPRWFDTGAARIPLTCALLEAGDAPEVSSA